MNNKLINEVKKEQEEWTLRIEKAKIAQMLKLIQKKDRDIKEAQEIKAELEKMLEERNYSTLGIRARDDFYHKGKSWTIRWN